jgi:hypothetical protein
MKTKKLFSRKKLFQKEISINKDVTQRLQHVKTKAITKEGYL